MRPRPIGVRAIIALTAVTVAVSFACGKGRRREAAPAEDRRPPDAGNARAPARIDRIEWRPASHWLDTRRGDVFASRQAVCIELAGRCSLDGVEPLQKLPPCNTAQADGAFETLIPMRGTEAGSVFARLRGRLMVSGTDCTLMECERGEGVGSVELRCCNQCDAAVGVLLASGEAVTLGGYDCRGGEALVACNAPADGRQVVAEGELKPIAPGASQSSIAAARLEHASLCEVSSATKDEGEASKKSEGQLRTAGRRGARCAG